MPLICCLGFLCSPRLRHWRATDEFVFPVLKKMTPMCRQLAGAVTSMSGSPTARGGATSTSNSNQGFGTEGNRGPGRSETNPAQLATPTHCVLLRWGGLLSLLDMESGCETHLLQVLCLRACATFSCCLCCVHLAFPLALPTLALTRALAPTCPMLLTIINTVIHASFYPLHLPPPTHPSIQGILQASCIL